MARLAASTALALCIAAPVNADVTAQQVWDDISAALEGAGASVDATETMTGDTLSVTDIAIVGDVPEEDATVRVGLAGLDFTDNGDGTVTVGYASPMPVTVRVDDASDPVDMTLELSHAGFGVTVSGDPGDMRYDYAAQSVGLDLVEVVADGTVLPPEAASLAVSMGPLSGRTLVSRGDGLTRSDQEIALGEVRYAFAFSEPDGRDAGRFDGRMAAVSFAGTSSVPAAFDGEDLNAAIGDGFAIDGSFLHQGGALDFSVTEAEGTTTGATTSESARIDVALSGDGMRYALQGRGTTVALAGPEIPLPIEAELGETGFSITLPTTASDAPQDAALTFTLGDLVMSPMIWNMLDPAERLPRDPLTVILDVAARVAPDVDLFDEAAMAALAQDALPGALESATLNELRISAVGAEVTGTGGFTFDNSDLDTFDGLPRPEGALSFSLSGVNGLVQALSEMGILPQEQVGAVGMMLALFTVPGSEPDTATSVLEINAQGHVLANGQRIQ